MFLHSFEEQSSTSVLHSSVISSISPLSTPQKRFTSQHGRSFLRKSPLNCSRKFLCEREREREKKISPSDLVDQSSHSITSLLPIISTATTRSPLESNTSSSSLHSSLSLSLSLFLVDWTSSLFSVWSPGCGWDQLVSFFPCPCPAENGPWIGKDCNISARRCSLLERCGEKQSCREDPQADDGYSCQPSLVENEQHCWNGGEHSQERRRTNICSLSLSVQV